MKNQSCSAKTPHLPMWRRLQHQHIFSTGGNKWYSESLCTQHNLLTVEVRSDKGTHITACQAVTFHCQPQPAWFIHTPQMTAQIIKGTFISRNLSEINVTASNDHLQNNESFCFPSVYSAVLDYYASMLVKLLPPIFWKQYHQWLE